MDACVSSDALHEDPLAPVRGIMYVSGYVMLIKDDGKAGIVSARGGGGKFVLIQLSHFYVNKKLVERPHNLHTFLKRGSYINLFIEDLGRERMIVSFKVRYESVMCWIGSHGEVPDVGLYSKFWRRWELECSKIPSDTSYDVHVDVPVSTLTEHSGIVYWCSETYGLVSMKEGKTITNALFTSDSFYLAQRKFLPTENLAFPTANSAVVAITKPISRRKIFGVNVDMEAVVVYLGDKPVINLIYRDPKLIEPTLEYQELEDSNNYSPTENDSFKNKTKSWAEEANDVFRENRVSLKPALKEVEESPSNHTRTASYLTGRFLGFFGGYFVYGSEGKACRFTVECFHVSKVKLSTVKAVLKYLSSQTKAPILHGYVTALKQPIQVGPNVRIVWDAECAWHGPAPASLKVKINSLKKVPLRTVAAAAAGAANCSQTADLLVDRKDLMATLPQIPFNDAIKRGRLAGYVLSCSASDAIVTGFSNTVYLTRERFYVNGQKYRGTSLLSYFQKKNDKVNTYIVPMKMRVVRGCAVYSRAVCAWIGDEPADLQKMILTDKIYTNFEISDTREKSKGQFYYMVGHIQKMGETCGLIACQVDGSTVNVGFSIHELYKYGKKVSSRSILSMHSQVLLTSRWSVLAYCAPHESIPGSDYTAVAVWHHGNQMLLFDEFQTKLPLWHKQLLAGKCSCADSIAALVDRTYASVSKGAITERHNDEVAVGIKDQGIVYVKRDHVIVDGCSCCLSRVDMHRMCYVAFDANKSPLYAWMGKQPGCGRARSDGIDISHVDCTSDDSDAESDCDGSSEGDSEVDIYEEEEEDQEMLCGDLSSMELSDPSELFSLVKRAQSVQKTIKTARRKDVVASHGELDNFSGLHAVGRIVDIKSDYAILAWFADRFKGTIFIYLGINHLYINGEPFKKTCYTQLDGEKVLMDHVCHMYLNTVPESKHYGLLEICAVASAGWVGRKPIFMPPPGKQGKGVFDTQALRIAYSKPPHSYVEFSSYDSWLEHLENDSVTGNCDWKHEFPPGFLVAKTADEYINEAQDFATFDLHPNNGYGTSHSPVSDFSTPAIPTLNYVPSVTEYQNQLNVSSLLIDTSLATTTTTGYDFPPSAALSRYDDRSLPQNFSDNFTLSSSERGNVTTTPTPPVSTSSIGLDQFTPEKATIGSLDLAAKSSQQGRVVELHPHLGKLRGHDGSTHYFRAEQFFLYGVPLRDVELYDVLIQDMEVQYSTRTTGDLESCWYGSRLPDPVSYVQLNQWCARNFVSDDVRTLLAKRANCD